MANFAVDLVRFASIAHSMQADDPHAWDRLILAREDRITVQWAPFEHTPRTARLVIVGITPGRVQAVNALRAFRDELHKGAAIDDALRLAKLVGSFSGPMRTNIVEMLDCIEVPPALDVQDGAALFNPAYELVHFTSALRYPVFVDGENYNGNPDMLRTPLLREMIETFLEAEARLLQDALWLPLGPKPAIALRHLVSRGALRADHVLEGMPHPSGANAERIKFFLGLKARTALSQKTRPDLIEAARETLLAQVRRLRSV